MGSRTTPVGDDRALPIPTERPAKQLRRNAVTQPRSGCGAEPLTTPSPVQSSPVPSRRGRERPARRRRDVAPGLIDQLHLDGDSVLEVDLTPDVGSPVRTPSSRREARELSRANRVRRPNDPGRSPNSPGLGPNSQGSRVFGAAVATAVVMLVPGVTFLRPAQVSGPEDYIASSIAGEVQHPV